MDLNQVLDTVRLLSRFMSALLARQRQSKGGVLTQERKARLAAEVELARLKASIERNSPSRES